MLKYLLAGILLLSCKPRNFNSAETQNVQLAEISQPKSANALLANCDSSSILNNWSFVAPLKYDEWTADKKLNTLWELGVITSCYRSNELPKSTSLDPRTISIFKPKFLEGSFDLKTDWNLSGRKKFIHSKGSVVKVRFVPNQYSQENYTGLYQTGAIGLARLSLATGQTKESIAPGMALKFFISGPEKSRDVFVMFSVDGQGSDQNFFAHDFSNVVPPPKSIKTKSLALSFKQLKNNPSRMHISHLANVNTDGTYTAKDNTDIRQHPKSPVNLLFKPKVTGWKSSDQTDFRINLINFINQGTVLYDVYALSGNQETLDLASAKLIGQLVADSEPIPSKFGDDFLWFSHSKQD